MAYKIVVMPQAEADIAEAFRFLSEVAPEVAVRWYRHIKGEIESLTTMPARCPLAPEAAKLGIELRHLLHGKRPSIYRIVFRIVEEAEEIHILTVRHGARKSLTPEEIQPFLQFP